MGIPPSNATDVETNYFIAMNARLSIQTVIMITKQSKITWKTNIDQHHVTTNASTSTPLTIRERDDRPYLDGV